MRINMVLQLYQKVYISTLKQYTVVFGNSKHYNIISNNVLLKIHNRESHNKPITPDTLQKSGQAKVEDNKKQNSDLNKVLKDDRKWNRIVRGEPPPVLLGFMPMEWRTYFLPKTGVSGFYTFLVTFGTFLFSKELYVLEHEFYNGLGMFTLCAILVKKAAPATAKLLDKWVDEYEYSFNVSREQAKAVYNEGIQQEERNQWRFEGQRMLVEAKRENVALQLEAAYRQRLLHVYDVVKKRLDYQLEAAHIREKLVQKNIINYVVREVHKSLSQEYLSKYFDRCVDDLAGIIARHKKLQH